MQCHLFLNIIMLILRSVSDIKLIFNEKCKRTSENNAIVRVDDANFLVSCVFVNAAYIKHT